MFVNEKIIRIYSFVHFQHETKDKCILKGVLWQKPVTPPHDPLKYPTGGAGMIEILDKKYKKCKNAGVGTVKLSLVYILKLKFFKII